MSYHIHHLSPTQCKAKTIELAVPVLLEGTMDIFQILVQIQNLTKMPIPYSGA